MLVVGNYDFVCPQGSTFEEVLSFQIDGVPINLTGYQVSMQVRRAYGVTPLITLTSTPSSGITINGSAGTVSLLIAYATTETFEAGQYLYDLELTSAGGNRKRYLSGLFIVTSEVTVV